MSFRHTRAGTIRINDIVYNLSDILSVVPEYMLPVGMSHSEMDIDSRVYTESGNQIKASQVYVDLVTTCITNLTDIQAAKTTRESAEIATEQAAINAEKAARPLDIRKQEFYNQNNITTERVLRAIIQRDFDNDDAEWLAVKAERLVVKGSLEFPIK